MYVVLNESVGIVPVLWNEVGLNLVLRGPKMQSSWPCIYYWMWLHSERERKTLYDDRVFM